MNSRLNYIHWQLSESEFTELLNLQNKSLTEAYLHSDNF